MAVDDCTALAPRQHRLDEAPLAEAALTRVELVLGDPTRVGRIGPQTLDRH